MTKKWDTHREVIIYLYKEQNMPLDQVKKILKDQYGFAASTRAFRTRFEKWGISKYNCQRRRDSIGARSTGSAPPSPSYGRPVRDSSSPVIQGRSPRNKHIGQPTSPASQDSLYSDGLAQNANEANFNLPLRPGPAAIPACSSETTAAIYTSPRQLTFQLPVRTAPIAMPSGSPVTETPILSGGAQQAYFDYYGTPYPYHHHEADYSRYHQYPESDSFSQQGHRGNYVKHEFQS